MIAREVCIWKVHGETKEVEFMGIFQRTKVLEPVKWGESISANTVAGPVAVIKAFGTLMEVDINSLQFEHRLEHWKPTNIPMKGPCQL